MSERCTATTAAGRRCRAWAVHGSDPPRCSTHGGRRERAAADKLAALLEQTTDLDARIAGLGNYIDAKWEDLNVRELCLLLDLYSKMLGRVTRMRRARQALGGANRELGEALLQVLDEMHGRGMKT